MFPFASLLAIALVFFAVAIVVFIAMRLARESVWASLCGGVSVGLLLAACVAVIIIAVVASMKLPPFISGAAWFAVGLGVLVAALYLAAGSEKRSSVIIGGATTLSFFAIASSLYVI